ncbi:helix-turn-helix transcriptional regulator [Candidatus Woesearchaeota archaeon]|nr:helix-turn-helix transcriptional regulator [Candidatus Woesearchaeota archaeon]
MRTKLRQPYRQFFGTLANQYRLDIVRALVNGPLNVGAISRKTGLEQTTISHNLKRLRLCGFVFDRKDGKERIYTLNHKTIKPLLSLMDAHMGAYCSKLCGDDE